MFAQASQSVASAYQRSTAAVSEASLSCHLITITIAAFFILAIIIFRVFHSPNSPPIPTNFGVPRTDSPDLGYGNPNFRVPVLNSSTILDLAEFDEEGESLRKAVNLILEGDLEKFFRSTDYLRWRGDLSLDVDRPSFFHTAYLQSHPLLLDWSVRRLMYNRYRPAEEILSELLGCIGRLEKYSSCVVVNNSFISSDDAVDSPEAVIRVNSIVDKKTNISFIDSDFLHLSARWGSDKLCHPYGVAVVLHISKPIHLLDIATCNSAGTGEILVTDPGFDRLCANIVKYYSLRRWFAGGGNRSLEEWKAMHEGAVLHYSIAMQAVVMAVGVCERISLFGFRQVASEGDLLYDTSEDGERKLYEFVVENEFYKDLMEAPERILFLSSVIGKFEFPSVVVSPLVFVLKI